MGIWQSCQAGELIIRHERPVSDRDLRSVYYLDLLALALQKAAPVGLDYTLQPTELKMIQSRLIVELEANRAIDVLWSVTNIDREERLRPIRIPLVKGLLGYRVFIVRKNDTERYSKIESIDDLRVFDFGQGADWSDTKILKANNFNVVTSSSYEALFTMLSAKRFDLFSRSVFEAYTEVQNRTELALEVEPSIALKYNSPTFFFFNKDNHQLATLVERGLMMAIADGSFDKFFFEHPMTQSVFNKANLTERKTFYLENIYLSPETAQLQKQKQLWY
jgi:ABC-type amino acid transport substrate-binding protein